MLGSKYLSFFFKYTLKVHRLIVVTMSKVAHVVDGEASESDSEIEIEIVRSPVNVIISFLYYKKQYDCIPTWFITKQIIGVQMFYEKPLFQDSFIENNTKSFVIAGEAPESDDGMFL